MTFDAYQYPLLIKHLLHTPLNNAPDQEIVSGLQRRYRYREFRRRIGRLARGLSKIGVKSGDTIAVMDWDNHRYLECFFAIPMMAATLHTINIRLSPEQILYTINHAEDDVVLVHEEFLPVLEQIKDRIKRRTQFILVTDQTGEVDPPQGFITEYEALLADADDSFEFEDFDENTRATTFYTTGTTGDPKGVYYSHRQLVLHTLGVLAGISTPAGESRFHKGDVYMPITPMFHVHGWGFPYAATLMGVKQVYPGRYDPVTLVNLIIREGVTFSHCVPTILHMLLSAPGMEEADLSNWKVIIGGSAMPQGLAKAALERGINAYSAYGMSETCPLLTVADVPLGDEDFVAERCKTGNPTPMVEIRVVDSNMKDVQRDGRSTGEVVVRTPWLTQGYTKNPQGSDALWQGGYLHTGDVGYLDHAGALQITDRMKDVIKSGGEWISSLALESIASRCDGVGEVAAIGIPDHRWGERPLLLVVKSEDAGSALDDEAVRETIRREADKGNISKWAVPDKILFVDQLEKTSVGKMDKKRLRLNYANR